MHVEAEMEDVNISSSSSSSSSSSCSSYNDWDVSSVLPADLCQELDLTKCKRNEIKEMLRCKNILTKVDETIKDVSVLDHFAFGTPFSGTKHRTLFFFNLAPTISTNDLWNMVNTVVRPIAVSFRHGSNTGAHDGKAFVTVHNIMDALQVYQQLQEFMLFGHRIKIELSTRSILDEIELVNPSLAHNLWQTFQASKSSQITKQIQSFYQMPIPLCTSIPFDQYHDQYNDPSRYTPYYYTTY